MEKLPLENQNNKAIEWLNEINHKRSIDLEEALIKWFGDFLASENYNQLLINNNIINYSNYFLLSEDYKMVELIKIYQNLPTANNLIILLRFLFGDFTEIKVQRFRHKYLKIELTLNEIDTTSQKNLITNNSENLVTNNNENIVAKTRKLGLSNSNLINLFFLIINFNTLIDVKIIENETTNEYSNYIYNHNPLNNEVNDE